MKLDENRTRYIYEYDELFHRKVAVAEGECLICKHRTDMFYDDTNGPYMVSCEFTKRIGEDDYSLSCFKKYGESCPKYEYDGLDREVVNG